MFIWARSAGPPSPLLRHAIYHAIYKDAVCGRQLLLNQVVWSLHAQHAATKASVPRWLCSKPAARRLRGKEFRFFRDPSCLYCVKSRTSLGLVPCSIVAVLSMSTNFTRRPFTFDDCLRMVEVGILQPSERVELINGDLVVMIPIGPRHGGIVDRTSRAFINSVGDKAIIRTQGTVVLDPFAAPQPDIVLLRTKHDDYLSKNPGVEDILLIIEVAETSLEYDSTAKLGLYAILGIHEYWIADIQNGRVLVHSQPAGDNFTAVKELHRDDTIAPSLLPDCRIPVDLLLP
jgi:Uma2 family endonuclease